MIVFFIHDNQFQAGKRGKEGGSGADDQLDVSVTNPAPLVITDPFRNAAVNDGDPLRVEPSGDPRNELRRQRYFRHEINRRPALFKRPGDRGKIDLGFSAAGDAVE